MLRNFLTNQTYMYRHYFNDQRIKDFALDEFVRCCRSGRMTAFVGSMATESLGYLQWNDLLSEAVKLAFQEYRGEPNAKLIREFWKRVNKEIEISSNFDARVAASAIGHLVELVTGNESAGETVNELLAKELSIESKRKNKKNPKIIDALLKDLGINRFITTNYDMEIEFHIHDVAEAIVSDRYSSFFDSITQTSAQGNETGDYLKSVLTDGRVLESDAFSRRRLDRLIEFSTGSAETDFHVMHLHGRFDEPETMILSYRDYDRRYRKEGRYKLPFDQALSMLHSANPEIFVGLGMSEPELNQTLEELVGNQPYKGIGRRFLLWNAPDPRLKTTQQKQKRKKNGSNCTLVCEGPEEFISAEELKANFRLEKLHKLGVLTIFDDELGQPTRAKKRNEDDRVHSVRRLNDALVNLGSYVKNSKALRLRDLPDISWRTADFMDNKSQEPVFFTWHFDRKSSVKELQGHLKRIPLQNSNQCLTVRTSRPGAQKGLTATAIAMSWCYDFQTKKQIQPKPKAQVLFINASLRLDTDSILESLCNFLIKQSRLRGRGKFSRERIFKKAECFYPHSGRKPMIIFKGLERLFSKTGIPLSAEMDRFFRCYVRAAIQRPTDICPVLAYGTRRVRIYFSDIQEQVRKELAEENLEKSAREIKDLTKTVVAVDRDDEPPGGYLTYLRKLHLVDNSQQSPPKTSSPLAGDRSFARDTYRRVFASKKFRGKFDSDEEEIAFAVLTVMAFVGQPVEVEALFHAPRLQKALNFESKLVNKRRRLKDAIAALKDLGLVHKIGRVNLAGLKYNHSKPYHLDRYALHKTLQAEMRERYGVPLSESVLSTSFNMSLYAAQPADAAIADPQVHDELGKLIDWLMGAYQDKHVYNPKHRLPTAKLSDKFPEYRARPHIAASLRAALAIVRGFYSITSLLSLDVGDRPEDEQRDGALTEHANRIERLLKAFVNLSWQREERKKIAENQNSTLSDILELLGPAAIYRDELVWLYNERGVVKLAQGDLYEARHSFNDADRINGKYVEFACRSHNWRRIWLNQTVVDIERGKLVAAEDRLGRIENSFDNFGMAETIRKEIGSANAGVKPKLPVDVSHEDCLSVSLATGYKALVLHLRGELHSSANFYKLAIRMLENLDEQRACALFRKHYSSLIDVLENATACSKMAKLATAGAESVQQMDIVYSARMIRHAEYAKSETALERKWAMQVFSNALKYSTETDLHRVGIEARRSLATLKLNNGDLESALEHATIAMGLAGRYGMSLYKISLRILLGRILSERKNFDAGNALVKNAIVQADRIGYQRGVDAAQYALGVMQRDG